MLKGMETVFLSIHVVASFMTGDLFLYENCKCFLTCLTTVGNSHVGNS